ncbi:MAG: uracil phosphoribosyltransferase [Armatimonadota bacterium]
MERVTVLDHPLVRVWVTELRSAETPNARVRDLLRNLSVALFLEASRELETVGVRVRTPLTETGGARLERAPLLVPILRAGLGMVDGILELVPEADVAHLGLYRDHDTLEPVTYYTPSHRSTPGRELYVLDPMLATGGSVCAALDVVKTWAPGRVHLLSVIGAPPGVERVRSRHPDVSITLAALDERLNEIGYIVPGLGDAGDRQFGG